MKRTRGRRTLSVLAVTGAVLGLASSAHAATVVNGDFETGTLAGFEVRDQQNGSWYAYGDANPPPQGCASGIASPPQGNFAASSAQDGPGSHVLYQDIALEPNRRHQLSYTLYYRNGDAPSQGPSGDSREGLGVLDGSGLYRANDNGRRADAPEEVGVLGGDGGSARPFATPNTLDPAVFPNQQYRVDILKPTSDPFSVASADVLARIFRTEEGDPNTLAPTRMTFDLTPYAGQTVRLRFAEVDNQGCFLASVDDIDIRTSDARAQCTINGTPGNDILRGTPDNDVICGAGGNDIIYGLGGNDELRGGGGNDILRGGPGNDKLSGGEGNDQLIGGDGRDRLEGGAGSDDLSGQGGADSLDTRDDVRGNDVANGGSGDDSCSTDPRDVRTSC